MSKSFKFNPDQRYDLQSKKAKQEQRQQGRINKQFLRSVTE